MRAPLRILYLEDDPLDAELVHGTLQAGGIDCDCTRVETKAELVAALQQGGFDLLLADYTLPSFDGLSALHIAQQGWPQLPFVFVSGTLDEEVAIETLKIGATDYVFKTRLARIVPSVQRALREAEERIERRRAEEALRRSEAYLAEAQRLSHTGSFGWDLASGQLYWSRETFRIMDYGPDSKVTIDHVVQRTHPEDRTFLSELIERVSSEKTAFDCEHRLLMPDGAVKHLRVVGYPSLSESGTLEFVGAVTDITERKRAESDLKNALGEIKRLRDQLYKENIALRDEIDKASMFEEIVGESLSLRAVLARVAKVAPTDSTVLISGETGTGKELIARAIHKRSQRSSRAFVSVNCAATPQTLIAAELFGYEKGAFTGANQRHAGRFEVANHGTIFLDEVGEMPGETQVALLRVLQEREFERVGGTQSIPVDVRVIAATNCDLPAAVRSGKFRVDLFYRLNVFPIHVPPLRQRPEDIDLLAKYFIERYAAKAGKRIRRVDNRTAKLLETYHWPGNIRELQNVIERAMILCDSDTFSVEATWFQPEAEPGAGLQPSLINQERELIEAALAESRGRVSGPDGAARRLGVPRTTLEYKIKSLRIDKYRYRFEAREPPTEE
jgi:PAS domain S-box-containing protein